MQLPRISSDYAFINVKQIVYYTERRGGRNSETNRMPARIRASCRPRHKLVLEADARLIAESRNTNSKLSRERYSTPTNSPRVPRRNSRGGIVRVAGQKRIGAVWKRGDELVPRLNAWERSRSACFSAIKKRRRTFAIERPVQKVK